MSSYSLRGGPWLVDYRIALTDQKELWLLSKSPTQRKVSSERARDGGGGGGELLNRCWLACCLTSLQTLIDAFRDSYICPLRKEEEPHFLLTM